MCSSKKKNKVHFNERGSSPRSLMESWNQRPLRKLVFQICVTLAIFYRPVVQHVSVQYHRMCHADRVICMNNARVPPTHKFRNISPGLWQHIASRHWIIVFLNFIL